MALPVSPFRKSQGSSPALWRKGLVQPDETLSDVVEDLRFDEVGLEEYLGQRAEEDAVEAEARLVDEVRKASGRRFMIDMTLGILAIGVGAAAFQIASIPVEGDSPGTFESLLHIETMMQEVIDLKEGFFYRY